MRDGDWKYLHIAGNEFLFDVVNDWAAWNNTMSPQRPRPAAYGNPGNALADHYGVTNPPAAAAPSSAAQR